MTQHIRVSLPENAWTQVVEALTQAADDSPDHEWAADVRVHCDVIAATLAATMLADLFAGIPFPADDPF